MSVGPTRDGEVGVNVRLTRRGFVAGITAAALAPEARAEPAAVRTFIGKTGAELAPLLGDALAAGFRFASLSLYGPPHAPLYAILMRRQVPLGDQPHWLALDAKKLDKTLAEQAAAGFGPALIAATGPATAPVFALVCERQSTSALIRTALKSGKPTDKASIEGMNRQAKREGRILRSVAAYGSGADPRFVAIWITNEAKTAWNADGTADTVAVYRAREHAHASAWRRPALIAPTPNDRYLSLFVDSQVDRWAAAADFTAATLAHELAAWDRKGLSPIAIQAAGANAGAARFAAIAVGTDEILPRAWNAAGPVTRAEIDDVMKSVMTRSRIRQSSLAIVKGARLVYARGYTFAEAGWPVTQPTTFFRLASVSKTVTALGIYQLIERGKLQLSDHMQDILKLRTPSGAPPKDKRFSEVTIEQMLAHNSGINANEFFATVAVRNAFVKAQPHKTWHLPVTADMTDAFIAELELVSPPGKVSNYNNCAYYLLGRIVAKLNGETTALAALRKQVLDPLGIKRLRHARSLVADQPPDEARYSINSNADHARDIPLRPSVMSDTQPLVPIGYGNGQLEISEGAGGFSAAMTDLVRMIAILIDTKDNAALRRDTLRQMLANAAQRHGHGLDVAKDLGNDRFYGQKGGSLSTSWNVLQMNGDYGFALCWAGVPDPGVRWYPDFPAVMNVARRIDWGTTDLFEQFGMRPL
jgi:CubicO group peptidase (beta-lactamase class C family)